MPAPHTPRRTPRLMLLLALLMPLLAGCGSSSSSSSAPDPAAAVPASAPVYVSVVVKPTGSLQSDTQTVAEKLTHEKHPFQKLLEENKGSQQVKWSEIEPWVGERVGVFLSSLGSGTFELSQEGSKSLESTSGALVAQVSDLSKARSFLSAEVAREGTVHSASFDGVSYETNSKGNAEGIVGSYAVIGTEAGVKSVIETVKGGASLAHSSTYSSYNSKVSPGAIASVYANLSSLLGSLQTGKHSQERELGLVRQLLKGKGQVLFSVIPSQNSVTLEGFSQASASEESKQAAGAQMFSTLPSDSWFALGIGDLGANLEGSLQSLEQLSKLTAASGLGETFPSLKNLNGANIKREFLSWMGSAGIFASGSSLLNITAGIVIDSKNPTASREAVPRLASLLRSDGASVSAITMPGTESALAVKLKNSPLTVDVADGQGKFVIGIGEGSIQSALKSSSPLSGTSTYSAAQSTLGQGFKPSLLVDFPTVIGVLESLSLQENPTFGKSFDVLRSLGMLTAGSSSASGGVMRSRAVLDVQ